MKYLLLPAGIIITLLVIQGCKQNASNANDRLIKDLKTYFTAKYLDSTLTLDSFRIVALDTITPQKRLVAESQVLTHDIDLLLKLMKNNTEQMTLIAQQLKLYQILGSRDLIEIKRTDFNKLKDKGERIKSDLDSMLSIAHVYPSKIDSSDSLNPIGYEARCFFQVRRQDRSIERDTTFIYLNESKDIVDRRVFFKSPFSLDLESYTN